MAEGTYINTIITHNTRQQEIHVLLEEFQNLESSRTGGRSAGVAASDLVVEVTSGNTKSYKAHTDIHYTVVNLACYKCMYNRARGFLAQEFSDSPDVV